jgi:hypothetical protein
MAKLDHLGEVSERSIKFLDGLFSSLQHRAFSGQL